MDLTFIRYQTRVVLDLFLEYLIESSLLDTAN